MTHQLDIDNKCQHAKITTWVFEDTGVPCGTWSCAECGRRFEPLKSNDSTHAQDVSKDARVFDVEKLAREAGFSSLELEFRDRERLKLYTKLVLEEAAYLCDHMPSTADTPHDCADAIRALAEGVR